jgi:hypothetical protein
MKIGFNRFLMLTLDPISFLVSESLVIFQNHGRNIKERSAKKSYTEMHSWCDLTASCG